MTRISVIFARSTFSAKEVRLLLYKINVWTIYSVVWYRIVRSLINKKLSITFLITLWANSKSVYEGGSTVILVKNELTVLYRSEDFEGKSSCEVRQWSDGSNMATAFERRYKLINVQGGSNMTGTNFDLFTHKSSRSYLNHLVLSNISATTAPVERWPSPLGRIATYFRSTPSQLSLLSTEKDWLAGLKKPQTFCDVVTGKFTSVNRQA
jgi:hypothetical protein